MRVAIDANTIISGLFYRGNERRLLLESVSGGITLVLAEDIIEEVYRVVEETFRHHPDLPEALELLGTVFASGELIERQEYLEGVAMWVSRLRDPSDAPLVACAVAAGVDGLVTGDKDILELGDFDGIKVYQTRGLLELMASGR